MVKFDLAVIGSGPGGFAATMRAVDFGKNVCLIELLLQQVQNYCNRLNPVNFPNCQLIKNKSLILMDCSIWIDSPNE